MIYTTVEHAAPALASYLRDKRHILLITHVNPDGDAIGSLMGLGLALDALGHAVTLLTPNAPPPFVANIPAVNRVQSFSYDPSLPADVDMVILVDTGDVKRIARVWEDARDYLLARPIAVIDHHVTNSGEGSVNYVDPSRSSTCELIYELLRAWDVRITPDIATALLFGITTDTQSFRTSNTTPSALRAAANLLEAGGDREQIVHDVYNNIAFSTARLMGHALLALRDDGPIVWTHVTLAVQAACGAHDDAAAEVTDYLSSLGGYLVSVLFKERSGGIIRVSLRSQPSVDVSAVAQQFGGGGHRQAAGCTLSASLSEAEERVLAAVRAAVGLPAGSSNPEVA
ncbi:MAG TPA: bifunctional oligoribonuclease/PAP phosphatase NrnA [Herpetosiphonaceae bacterium]|nr:bifunctional oligoribonuclease/PAP phosphatase NrnA [Herpetosiphonaceae bacterium]